MIPRVYRTICVDRPHALMTFSRQLSRGRRHISGTEEWCAASLLPAPDDAILALAVLFLPLQALYSCGAFFSFARGCLQPTVSENYNAAGSAHDDALFLIFFCDTQAGGTFHCVHLQCGGAACWQPSTFSGFLFSVGVLCNLLLGCC